MKESVQATFREEDVWYLIGVAAVRRDEDKPSAEIWQRVYEALVSSLEIER